MTADLFHVGHLSAIINAKEGCDFLVIGLLTDRAVEEYKKTRPIIPFVERAIILNSLRWEVFVIPQDSISPMDNLKLVGADIVFSGDGFEPEEKRAIKVMGCKIENFKYYAGQSSTKIKRRIKRM